jgi:hypothetical protein
MRTRLILAATLLASSTLAAQDKAEKASARTPISIGNYPAVNGLRLNFRDDGLQRVNGANVTIWTPYDPASGTVKGLALGLPLTGAREIDGVATGLLGVGVDDGMSGVVLAPIGAGAGHSIRGIALAGVGIGGGGNLSGLIIGGVGAGAGGNLNGIVLGGVGAGAGGNGTGLIASGVGAGLGGNMRGVLLGGVGAGVGGNITGVAIGGVGAGAGGSIKGLAVGGVGIGAGESIRGIAIAGVGVGAPLLHGGFAALAVGAKDATGVILAPVLFKIERGGSFRGGSISAVNYLRGSQAGITIALFNYARSLDGVQIGVLNIVSDAKSHPVLPIINWGSDRR